MGRRWTSCASTCGPKLPHDTRSIPPLAAVSDARCDAGIGDVFTAGVRAGFLLRGLDPRARRGRTSGHGQIGMNAPQTPYERFMAALPVHAAQRGAGGSWRLYEALKQDFVRAVPGANSDEYARAMHAIARAAGV